VSRGLLRASAQSKIATLQVVQPWTRAVVRALPSITEVNRGIADAVTHQRSQTLVTPVGQAASEAGRDQFRELVRRATQEIRLGVYSSKTAYPEVKDLVREKLRHGDVRVRILMLSPDLAVALERDNALRNDVLERTQDWRKLAADVERERGHGGVDFELRWLTDKAFAAFRRVMLVDGRAWMLTVHRTGQRGVEGFVHTGTGEGGESNLYHILDHYWKSAWMRAVNPFAKTHVFIGSSSSGLPAARALASLLTKTQIVAVTVWPELFRSGGRFTLEVLLDALDEFEFAVLVMTADDEKIVRGIKTDSPRDNVVFELGMFMTRIGRQRALFVCEEADGRRKAAKQLEIPTDLAGVTALKFRRSRTAATNEADLREVSESIADQIRKFRRDFPKGRPRVRATLRRRW
jgi:predicted nucleotide-binding protein